MPAATDQQALELRTAGRSFSRIAQELGYERASHAVEAFNRALRLAPEGDRDTLRTQELKRLDAMANQVRGDESNDEATTARKLRTVEALRKRLLAP